MILKESTVIVEKPVKKRNKSLSSYMDMPKKRVNYKWATEK